MAWHPFRVLVDSSENELKVSQDGSDYKLDIITKVRNAAGTIVSLATETTLAAINATLTAINTTTGIKKIVDPLPAGTNNIGDVDVVSSALPTGAATEATLSGIYGKDFATETTLGAIKTAAESVDTDIDVALSTRATEATLLAADGRLTTIDAVLDSIKDIDGIKKITDQLPSGTNEIGKVAQGTKAVGSGAWPHVLYDSSGNAVGVVVDGVLYRLQVDAKAAKGASDLVHLDAIDTASGRGRLKTTLYTPDGDPVAFGSVPPNPSSIRNAFVLNGTSKDLLVDGSTTPVVFIYSADATYDISVQEIKFVIAASSITFGTEYFGSRNSVLPNGVLVEITAGGSTGTIGVLDRNESFVRFASPGGFNYHVSSKDMVYSGTTLGGGLKLKAGTGDNVKVTIRDNLSAAGLYFTCFVKGNLLPTS